MSSVFRRAIRQFVYRQQADRAASNLAKLRLGMRFDCYVSPDAFVYYPQKIQLAHAVEVHPHAVLNYHSNFPYHSTNIVIDMGTKVMPGARLIPQQGFIRIGSQCTIQYGCLLYGVGGLEIGDNVRIAANTVMTPMNHVFADPDRPIRLQGETAVGIRIGNDVWIGAGARILDGVEIGDGCVVGAGSVVTKGIPPYSVAVGVPARVIAHRGGSPDSR